MVDDIAMLRRNLYFTVESIGVLVECLRDFIGPGFETRAVWLVADTADHEVG